MQRTLEQQAYAHDNDYSHLEAIYHEATGGELVCDPYGSVRHGVPQLTLSASVIIPVWNEQATVEKCLIAIEQSTFNRKYPGQLEIIVVDDGSNDGTWELLERLRLNIHLKAARQLQHGRAHARNVALALSEGDVIICCDSDFILSHFTIEELMKRHQVLENVMLLGFYWSIDVADPRIQPDVLLKNLPHLVAPFDNEGRLNHQVGGWPENPCRDSNHLKLLGRSNCLIMADSRRFDMLSMIHGGLISLRRRDFVAMDGYDERFRGWGLEDTLVGVYALALGNYVVPVYSATGWHMDQGNRNPHRWREFAANQHIFKQVLQSRFVPNQKRWLKNARTRIRQQFERTPNANSACCEESSDLFEVFDCELADPARRGKYLYTLGRYNEAAAAFAEVPGTPEQKPWAVFDQGKALRAARHPVEAARLLEGVARCMPDTLWPLIELALALAAQNQFALARERLEQARKLDPTNAWLRFLLERPAYVHMERARHYARQANYALAVYDYEAALILEPHNTTVQIERAAALVALGEQRAAQNALITYLDRLDAGDPDRYSLFIQLAHLHQSLRELGPAKVMLERAWQIHPHGQEVTTGLNEVHAAAAKANPLPLTESIVTRCQDIPGRFGNLEAEWLVALVIRAISCCADSNPPILAEIGSDGGWATVIMGLAAFGLGRMDVKIMVMDDHVSGSTTDGHALSDGLSSQLCTHGLTGSVVSGSDAVLWKRGCQLLLVHGQHDYTGLRRYIEQYTPCLVSHGLLVVHDYIEYFPDVQLCINEFLLTSSFEFVVHVGRLIALKYCPEL